MIFLELHQFFHFASTPVKNSVTEFGDSDPNVKEFRDIMPVHLHQVQPALIAPLSTAKQQQASPVPLVGELFDVHFSKLGQLNAPTRAATDEHVENWVDGAKGNDDPEPEHDVSTEENEGFQQESAYQTVEQASDAERAETMTSGISTLGLSQRTLPLVLDASVTVSEIHRQDVKAASSSYVPPPPGFSGGRGEIADDPSGPMPILPLDARNPRNVKTNTFEVGQIATPAETSVINPLGVDTDDGKLTMRRQAGRGFSNNEGAIQQSTIAPHTEKPAATKPTKAEYPTRRLTQTNVETARAAIVDGVKATQSPQADQSKPDMTERLLNAGVLGPATKMPEWAKYAAQVPTFPKVASTMGESADPITAVTPSEVNFQGGGGKLAQSLPWNSTNVETMMINDGTVGTVPKEVETVASIQAKDPPLDAVLQFDPGTMRGSGDVSATRAETARSVAVQVADGVIKHPDRPVEIVLNPEELGRVRMVLSPSDTGLTVVIATERPETHDLMRRHIDLLAEEFRHLGYEDIGFEFTGGGAEPSTKTEVEHVEIDAPLAEGAEPQSPETPQRLASSGLDLRL